MTQHVFHFIAPIHQGSASLLQDQMLNALVQGATSFEIRMCTDGGTTFHGFALYNLIRSMPVPVTTINVGNVESMGVVMYLAGSHRIAVPHSRFLLHPLNWGFNEGRVDHARLTEHSLSLDNDLDRYIGIFSERTNGASQPVDVRSCLKNNAKVLTPDTAATAGVSQDIRLVELAAESVKWWINVS